MFERHDFIDLDVLSHSHAELSVGLSDQAHINQSSREACVARLARHWYSHYSPRCAHARRVTLFGRAHRDTLTLNIHKLL